MSFKDVDLKIEYRNSSDNFIVEFYIPLLEQAKTYKRAVGYFSSSALVEISKGICSLAKRGGKIYLVASPYLSDEDIEAIKKGYADREKIIENALLARLDEHYDYYSVERLNLLSQLIADGILEIQIAYLEDDKGFGLYHEKMGILEDYDGNIVAFSGSNNETSTAMVTNLETMDVFKGWGDKSEQEHVELKIRAFNSIWNNKEPKIKVLSFPKINEAIINKYRKKNFNLNLDSEQFPPNTLIESTKGVDFIINPSEKKSIGARVPEGFTFRQYQEDAIAEWVTENYRGIFDMATGAGKTYTGLGAVSRLSVDLADKLAVIIVCPYQHLVDQWVEDIEKFNMKPIIGYSSSPQKDWKKRLSRAVLDQRIRKDKSFFAFVTTNATFSSEFVQSEINKIKMPILLVVDEAHNFGARSYAQLLDDRFTYRLALSATMDRAGDEEGTKLLYDFFGRKCIEYTLDQAIAEEKLTKYMYYPVIVYLNEDELFNYDELSYQISKCLITSKSGKPKLNSRGKILAMQRSRLVAGASGKLSALRTVIEPYSDDYNILVYCGATKVLDDDKDKTDVEDDDIKQISAVTKILGNELGMDVAKFTSEESSETRGIIKEKFVTGDKLQAIVAIKCLDEGVNIPGIRTAFILASTTNPKEYIQRRGRVLRLAENKPYAEIFDFVTLPRPLDSVPSLTEEETKKDLSLVRNEVNRMIEFGRLAINSMDANKIIWQIQEVYNLELDYKEDL